MEKGKVVLAYSGGLDTSVIIPWLKENYDLEIIAVAVDVGQQDDFEEVEKRALEIGAEKFYVLDMKEEFVNEYIFPMIQSGAKYENKYLLGTAIARPVIAKGLVDIALKEGATYIAHGATGKGNDQVRFELAVKVLAPQINIIAPWRIWDIKSREDEIKYLQSKDISLPFENNKKYSRDENILHISHEGSELEKPSNEPNYDNVLKWAKPIEKANESGEYITIYFEKGLPKMLNGKKLNGVEMMTELNKLGAKHSIGINDMVENRLVGIKSRGVYETPGGSILYFAHEELERICLDKDTLHEKIKLSFDYADLVYSGKWFTTLRGALQAFIAKTREFVTGEVKLKLYKGNIILAGMKSPYSLYSEEYSTFEEDEVYNQKDAEGFINLFGLSMKIEALLRKKSQ